MDLERLAEIERSYEELEQKIQDPELIRKDPNYKHYMRKHGTLTAAVTAIRELRDVLAGLEEARNVAGDIEQDSDFRDMARDEIRELEVRIPGIEDRIRDGLVQDDEVNHDTAILEIRAGTGGDEAGLFARDLLRMYANYCQVKGWKTEVLTSSENDAGGYKEVVVALKGKGCFKPLHLESGVHRVQRVPATESQGRIHTSAATVALLPEAKETDLRIDQNDLKIDVMRAGGPGGQSVNTTDSAVRIVHVPTGITVKCQDEKSQHKNKARAMRVLRSRLLAKAKEDAANERGSMRRSLIGTGDRSERIRTYNFPQNRLTEHRINLTLYSLDRIMEGDLDEIITGLLNAEREKRLEELEF